ncbi:hypothetical protein N0V88_007939 [Collariella sp. IMI 366227]|nr:hypothetical protein N0V88_007939 [Collariella sp. IMI 366227]
MPSTTGPARKRSRTIESSYDGAADDEAHSKGGHSLRKRARIDYTQEMIDDDLSLPALKNETVVKATTTPSSRGRKRKGIQDDSDEDSDEFAADPKRHRVDKSPAPARAVTSRRRHASKKPSTDLGAYVDQPSDHEVQDTILVSVPMGLVASQESDQSSVQESRPTTSDESDADHVDVQFSTPDMKPSQAINGAVSVSAEAAEEIDNHLPFQNGDDKSHTSPTSASPTPTAAEQTFNNYEARRTSWFSSGVVQEPEKIDTQHLSSQPSDSGIDAQHLQQPERESSQQPSSAEPAIENHQSAAAPALESKSILESAASQLPETKETITLVSQDTPQSSRRPMPSGPARLAQLVRIYDAANLSALASKERRLLPYEDGDLSLPSPYTELVVPPAPPADRKQAAPAPAPTPPRAPAAAEWDPRRPLNTNTFFNLYRIECKKLREKGEPLISMAEFRKVCVRRHKAAPTQDAPSKPAFLSPESSISSTIAVEAPAASPTIVPESESLQPVESESQQPTAAPSPTPADEPMAQDEADDEDAEVAADNIIKTTGLAVPIEVTRQPTKQYLFPKIRDPNEFVDALEGWQDMDTDRLYEVTSAAVEALHAYQQEYSELKKLLDDEDNAKRRENNDKALVNWENRQKPDEPLPFRHFDETLKGFPYFDVRGMRAPKPYIDDLALEHQKEEDRIMAQAYGFKLNTHATQVGRQNPEEQRWEMPENRLRKRTEKGAELAEENVVEGKRTRKPRYVSDQSKDASRSGTPAGIAALGPGRRRRRGAAAINGDDADAFEPAQLTESFSESPRKGRPPRARAAVLAGEQDPLISVDQGDNNRTEDEEAGVEEKPKATRRRGRAAASLPEPYTSVPAGFGGDVSKPKRGRAAKGQAAGGEITSSSFYSSASAVQQDSRPSTSSSESSNHTAATAESTYSLRDKPKRNFALENDPELESRSHRRRVVAASKTDAPVEPPRSAARRRRKPPPPPPQESEPEPAAPPESPSQEQPGRAGPVPAHLQRRPCLPARWCSAPPPPPPSVKKPITKIKLTNHNGASSSSQGGSRATTPAANGASDGATNGKGGKRSRVKKVHAASSTTAATEAPAGAKDAATTNGSSTADLDKKPYAEMTKSEKMSWSMRRRWASGEMQGAVEKRRTTLANKKAERAATTGPNGSGVMTEGTEPGTEPSSANPSDPTTPASMHGQSLPPPITAYDAPPSAPQTAPTLGPVVPPWLPSSTRPNPYTPAINNNKANTRTTTRTTPTALSLPRQQPWWSASLSARSAPPPPRRCSIMRGSRIVGLGGRVEAHDVRDLVASTSPQTFVLKAGYDKIAYACGQAEKDGHQYVWVDTCCIDKRSSAEVSEATNSMFRWYQQAAVCYAYLEDVHFDDFTEGYLTWKDHFNKSRWFGRGWTLQELLAPRKVVFYAKGWRVLGTKSSLVKSIESITGIDELTLLEPKLLHHASVAQRLSWAANRTTTRHEDMAYSLMGLFGINMPIIYGEGENAFLRLQREIIKRSNDHSIFAWGALGRGPPFPHHYHPDFDNLSYDEMIGVTTVLAKSPHDFAGMEHTITSPPSSHRTTAYTMTNAGLHITLPLVRTSTSNQHLAILNCHPAHNPSSRLAILLTATSTPNVFLRTRTRSLTLVSLSEFAGAKTRLIYISNNPSQIPKSKFAEEVIVLRAADLLAPGYDVVDIQGRDVVWNREFRTIRNERRSWASEPGHEIKLSDSVTLIEKWEKNYQRTVNAKVERKKKGIIELGITSMLWEVTQQSREEPVDRLL